MNHFQSVLVKRASKLGSPFVLKALVIPLFSKVLSSVVLCKGSFETDCSANRKVVCNILRAENAFMNMFEWVPRLAI